MFGTKSFKAVFVQEIEFHGDGPNHLEAKAYLTSKPCDLSFIPPRYMQTGDFVGRKFSDHFHPVDFVSWESGVLKIHCFKMFVSVGSYYELYVWLKERVDAVYEGRKDIPKFTRELLERAAQGKPEERVFHNFTTEWPFKNQQKLIVYQNANLITPGDREGTHHQFRRVWFIESQPQLNVTYSDEHGSTGRIVALDQWIHKNQWFAFSEPHSGNIVGESGLHCYQLSFESKEESNDFLARQFRKGWHCSKVPIDEIRKLVGDQGLGDLSGA